MILLILILFTCTSQPIWGNNINLNDFLDAQQLLNKQNIQQKLTDCGFQKIYFTTTDNIKLCGLFLDQSHKMPITKTIIYCAGFYPGYKEGMSSFYALLADQPYNFLMFDARGHSESDGNFLTYQQLKNYGQNEYQDIIAAIHFVTTYNQQHNIAQNIIIQGICSGAFHTIKALEFLEKTSAPNRDCIKGIIFDSGWMNINDIVSSTISAEIQNQLKNSYFSWCIKPATYCIQKLYNWTMQPQHQQLPAISDYIQTATIPIWFVHCKNDPYIPITPVQKCVQNCNIKNYWWIDHDSHANYHMRNQKEYAQKLLDFLNQIDCKIQ